MRVVEVEGFEGVGRGLTHLIRLWKRVEKSKAAESDRRVTHALQRPQSMGHHGRKQRQNQSDAVESPTRGLIMEGLRDRKEKRSR
jgi:hypothetical protein